MILPGEWERRDGGEEDGESEKLSEDHGLDRRRKSGRGNLQRILQGRGLGLRYEGLRWP